MFDPNAYGEEVAHILALGGNGERPMPLAGGPCSSARALELLATDDCSELFGQSRAPAAALAGLYVYFSCRDEAHTIAQATETAEGSYWHAIVHRQEPDPGNSAYWFRRVGSHPVFPELRNRAAAAGVDVGPRWDPLAFIELCERARRDPGSELEGKALQVQLAEWRVLFDFCAACAPGRRG
jgi:hypothetical protein